MTQELNIEQERREFEAWYEAESLLAVSDWFKKDDGGDYAYTHTDIAWGAWLAAKRSVGGGESVAYLKFWTAQQWSGNGNHDVEVAEGLCVCEPGKIGDDKKPAFPVFTATPTAPTFQQRVQPWMLECFGEEISNDLTERNHRFLEEALELVQSTGCTQSEAHQLVDYVYGRPVGERSQEVGGVMVTLAALCLAAKLDMHAAGETELARIWTKVDAIRAKQAAKPKHSPLPQHVTSPAPVSAELSEVIAALRHVADDPMWADHAEVRKSTLLAWADKLDNVGIGKFNA